MNAKHARLVTIHVKHEMMDECIRIFREINAPSIARRAGFSHGDWWVDRTTGTATSVTLWDTAENEQASRANVPRLVEGMAHVLANNTVVQETFEAVHHQDPLSARR